MPEASAQAVVARTDKETSPPLTPEQAKAKREAMGIQKEDLLSRESVTLPENTGYAFSLWLKQRLAPLQEIVHDDPDLQKIVTLADELANAEKLQLVPLSDDPALQDNHGWKFKSEGKRTQIPATSIQPIILDEQSSRKFLRAVNDSIRNPLALIAGFAELQAERGTTDEIKRQNMIIKNQAQTIGDALQKIAVNDYKLSFSMDEQGTVSIEPHTRPVNVVIPA